MNPIMAFLHYLNPSYLPHLSADKSKLAIQREIVLQRVLNVVLILFTLIIPFVLGNIHTIAPIIITYLVLVAVTLGRSVNYHLRSILVTLALFGLGIQALLVYGLSGTGPLFLLGATVLVNLLYDQKVGVPFGVLGLAIVLVTGYAFVNRWLPAPQWTPQQVSLDITQWWINTLVMLFLQTLIFSAIIVILQGLNKSIDDQQKLTQALKEEQASLEQRVEERSADLKKRLNQFEVASQIVREIGSESNLDTLLNQAVNLIRDQFGFYHVGVFLNDERKEFAVLHAATGEAGRQMLERSHRLKIGEVGLVGYSISRGEARISMDVSGDKTHFKNPLLPDTRSEMALPMRIGDQAIGALDVQSVVENAFQQEDVRLLQTIADQLAIAFDKTRLLSDLQRSVAEMESSQASSIQKAWKTHIRNTRQRLAYRYRQAKLENQVENTPQAQEAMSKGQPVMRVVQESSQQSKGTSVLAVPIRLRNQVLGVVDIRFDSANVSPDLIALIEGTVSRLAVSLENARLLEEIQFRAERERLVNEISTKVRSAADVDSVLRIAVQEIGQSLGVSEVMVQLRKE